MEGGGLDLRPVSSLHGRSERDRACYILLKFKSIVLGFLFLFNNEHALLLSF